MGAALLFLLLLCASLWVAGPFVAIGVPLIGLVLAAAIEHAPPEKAAYFKKLGRRCYWAAFIFYLLVCGGIFYLTEIATLEGDPPLWLYGLMFSSLSLVVGGLYCDGKVPLGLPSAATDASADLEDIEDTDLDVASDDDENGTETHPVAVPTPYVPVVGPATFYIIAALLGLPGLLVFVLSLANPNSDFTRTESLLVLGGTLAWAVTFILAGLYVRARTRKRREHEPAPASSLTA